MDPIKIDVEQSRRDLVVRQRFRKWSLLNHIDTLKKFLLLCLQSAMVLSCLDCRFWDFRCPQRRQQDNVSVRLWVLDRVCTYFQNQERHDPHTIFSTMSFIQKLPYERLIGTFFESRSLTVTLLRRKPDLPRAVRMYGERAHTKQESSHHTRTRCSIGFNNSVRTLDKSDVMFLAPSNWTELNWTELNWTELNFTSKMLTMPSSGSHKNNPKFD